ncbi:MAG: hypothetical protein ACK417_05165 [Bacteroidia bacterium]
MSFFDRRKSYAFRPSEFWSDWLWQLPLLLQGVGLGFYKGGLLWFSKVNPAMRWGGMFNYSKSAVLAQIPVIYRPSERMFSWQGKVEAVPLDVDYPQVLKPDQGERGRAVHLVNNSLELKNLLSLLPLGDYVLQSYLNLPFEFGVFVMRNAQGRIQVHSLVWKIALCVVGDGQSTVNQLLEAHLRAQRFRPLIAERLQALADTIPEAGSWVPLHFAGNHCKGAAFIDASQLINAALHQCFDAVIGPMQGFNYGRLDVMVEEPEALWMPQAVQVLEVNGANSEPAHAYDPKHSWWFGLREQLRFQRQMWHIANRHPNAIHSPGYRCLITELGHWAALRSRTKSMRSHIRPTS